LLDQQLKKLVITAPASGVILDSEIEVGEVVQPGATLVSIGQIDNLKITVYVPEDRYGQIKLGMEAQVKVDSYPTQRFKAQVTYIADKAEFTPRNVQTAEGRRTTVFAVELSVANPDGKLKPGMPADVTFGK
jgi:multidrug resistance efflux pump